MPIINPVLIYLFHLINSIRTVSTVVCFASLIVAIISFLFLPLLLDEIGKSAICKIYKNVCITLFVSGTIYTFAPSETTMIQMGVASMVTHERVDYTKDIVEKVYKDILMLINKEGLNANN